MTAVDRAQSMASHRDRLRADRVWRGDHWYSTRAPRHGTLTAYTNYQCRCPDCHAARRAYDAARDAASDWSRRRYRPKPRARVPRVPKPPRHGTDAAYRAGCRCDTCRDRHNAARRAQYERRRDHLVKVDGRLVTTLETPHGHGHYITYRGYACRCAPCTEAHRQRMRANRERNRRNELVRLRVARAPASADRAAASS